MISSWMKAESEAYVNERRVPCPLPVLITGVLGCAFLFGQEPEPAPPPLTDYSRFATDEVDAARLRGVAFRLADWEAAANFTTEQGLRLRATFVPDALAYKVAKSYLELRRHGDAHADALDQLARSFPRWKRYQAQASIVLGIVNRKFRVSGRDRRIYTLQKSPDKGGVAVTVGKKKRLKTALAGKPVGLRLTDLRIKKFWTTKDGATRRSPSKGDPARTDPGAVGRVAKIGKPFASFVLEDKPVEIELLVSRALIKKRGYDEFRLDLNHWKRYEGPFAKDLLDLNEKRPWEPLRGVHVQVSTPPLGLTVGPELRQLVQAVRLRAEKAEP